MSSDPSNDGMNDSENEGGDQFNHEESTLINAMRSAISRQKAAFCCGGRVPITAFSDEGEEDRFDDVAALITSPPVVLRWDLPSGMYISCETSVLYYCLSFESVSGSNKHLRWVS